MRAFSMVETRTKEMILWESFYPLTYGHNDLAS
jgi:hypothetical protein